MSYLEDFLGKGFYGDEITLVLMSMMWQIRITVLQAETQIQTKIRHSNTLALTDMVLIITSRLHYFPASEYTGFYLTCITLCHISCKCTASVLYAPHWLRHIMVCCFIFLLPVKEKIVTTEDGESVIEWDLVKVAPLIKSLGYDLLNDDPGVYSDGGDFDGFCPDREWPDEELASHPDPVPIPQPTPTPSPTLSASDSLVKNSWSLTTSRWKF